MVDGMEEEDDYATTRLYRAKAADVYHVLTLMVENNRYFTLLDSDKPAMSLRCRANNGGAVYDITVTTRSDGRAATRILHAPGTGMGGAEQITADTEALFSGLLALLRHMNVIEQTRRLDVPETSEKNSAPNSMNNTYVADGGSDDTDEHEDAEPAYGASASPAFAPASSTHDGHASDAVAPAGDGGNVPAFLTSVRAAFASSRDVYGGSTVAFAWINTASRAVATILSTTPRLAALLTVDTLLAVVYLIVAIVTRRMPVWLSLVWFLVTLLGAAVGILATIPTASSAVTVNGGNEEGKENAVSHWLTSALHRPAFDVSAALVICSIIALIFSFV